MKYLQTTLLFLCLISPTVMAETPDGGTIDCQDIPLEQNLLCYRAALTDFLQSWISTWQQADIPGYFAHYVDESSPSTQMSRAVWEQYRRERLNNAQILSITIKLESMIVHGNGRTDVDFTQTYRSANYSDQVRKRLVLIRQQRSFLIEEEITLSSVPLR